MYKLSATQFHAHARAQNFTPLVRESDHKITFTWMCSVDWVFGATEKKNCTKSTRVVPNLRVFL